MKCINWLAGLALTLIIIFSVQQNRALADIITFDNFGPGGNYSGRDGGGTIGRYVGGLDDAWISHSFSPTVTGNLTTLDAALFLSYGITGVFELKVFHDTGSLSLLETITAVDLASPLGSGSLLTVNSDLNPRLIEGETYWLRASSPDPENSHGFWAFSDPIYWGSVSYFDGFQQLDWVNTGQGAFRVAVDPVQVPEPSVLSIFIIGLIGAWAVRRFSAIASPPA